MATDRDPDALLASVTDGDPADWPAAERSASPEARPRLALLHGLSRIAEFHRGLQRVPADRSRLERWGDLVLLECLGSGARADVWRAWDPTLEREVALKLMHEGFDDEPLLEEARSLARVRHPHVVTVLGVDRKDDRVGLWMELIRGGTVEQIVRAQGPLDAAGARRLGLEIGAAVAAVHAAGLLHRDIKPANVIRDVEGRFVLADFGLGLRENAPASERVRPSGTPVYMAPELLGGAPASEVSDLYSLGMVMWFAIAGRHPFEATTMAELIAAARVGPRPGLRAVRPATPAPLVAVVDRAIHVEPRERFSGLRPMIEALERWDPRQRRTGSGRWAAAVVVVAALVAGYLALRPNSASRTVAPSPPASAPAVPSYAVEASLLRREQGRPQRVVSGDRVRPGDNLWVEVRVTRPAWVYVLDEDDRGERYLLFPQARFDVHNPVPADTVLVLPGTVDGHEFAWTVTSAGGREHVLIVVSPEPIAEIEADLEKVPPADPGRPIAYAPVGSAVVEHLRGIGGMTRATPGTAPASPPAVVFDRFRALAGRETDVRGVWIRQIVLENPGR